MERHNGKCSFCALFYELTIIRFRIIIQNYPISDKMYLKGDWKRMEEQRTTVQSIGEKMLIVISGECVIIYLTREPKARVHLAAGNCGKKVAPYLTRTRALLFTLYVDNKSYYSA